MRLGVYARSTGTFISFYHVAPFVEKLHLVYTNDTIYQKVDSFQMGKDAKLHNLEESYTFIEDPEKDLYGTHHTIEKGAHTLRSTIERIDGIQCNLKEEWSHGLVNNIKTYVGIMAMRILEARKESGYAYEPIAGCKYEEFLRWLTI